MPVIPIEKVGEIQKLLTLAHDDSSHALKLIERMGSVSYHIFSEATLPLEVS